MVIESIGISETGICHVLVAPCCGNPDGMRLPHVSKIWPIRNAELSVHILFGVVDPEQIRLNTSAEVIPGKGLKKGQETGQ